MSETTENDSPKPDPAPTVPDPSRLAPELPKQCYICTRKDRKLMHLCVVNGGGNSMFSLLCDDQDNSPDGNKEPARFIICRACDAIISKLMRFRERAYNAQKWLSSIAEGRTRTQGPFNFLPPMLGARGSGPEAILEYYTQSRMSPTRPLLGNIRYVLPDGSAATLPPPREGSGPPSSLLELLEGIHQ